MLLRNFTCFLLLFFGLVATAQKFLCLKTYNVDSLLQILPEQHDEERVNTLNWLATSLHFEDTALSRKYADEAMELAVRLNYEAGKADAFRNKGHLQHFLSNYPKALQNYYEALSIVERLENKRIAYWIYYDIARTHFYAGNYEKAVEYGNLAIEKCNERVPGGHIAGSIIDSVHFGMGKAQTQVLMGKNAESLKYRLQLLDVMRKNNFPEIEELIITWTIGADYLSMGMMDSAKIYFLKALEFPDKNMSFIAQKYRALVWLSMYHHSAGETDTAILILKKCLAWYDNNGFIIMALYSSNILGGYYTDMFDLENAEKQFLESEKHFEEMLSRKSWYRYDSLKFIATWGYELYVPLPLQSRKEMIWEWGEWMYYYLFEICQKQDRTKEALKYHIAMSLAGDTLNLLKRNRDIIELQTKYETERKEEQIKALSKENEFQDLKLRQSRGFLIGLGGLVVSVLLYAWLILRQNKLRNEQQNLLLQQKLFRSQMNPHFIFNSLTSIQNFILDEEPDKASKYLSRFSKLVRHILDSSVEEYITLQKEMSTIENYLELQKVRFPEKFDYNIHVDDILDPENIFVPPMLAQPFIENAIEHGIKHRETKGNISISYTRNGQGLILTIEDDGIGREKAGELRQKFDKDHKSLATSTTQERIKVINRKLRRKITMEIIDLKDEQGEARGTRVVFGIPL
ncbi:MAG: histidine kinase [Bacteroidales bacterium]|nr:histidine kinase [Bacteroidales bacterium]